MRIAFLGLGSMGLPMVRNLIKGQYGVTVWNRTRDRGLPLEAEGAHIAVSPADCVAGADIAITMLADDRAIDETVFGPAGLVETLPREAIHLSMSTIGVATVRRLADAHRERGQRFACAPVFGRPDAAAAARLAIVAAGAPDTIAACQPMLDVLGQRTFIVGDDPALAIVVKLSGNFLIASAIESLGEAVALVRKAGVDPAGFVHFLTSTLFDAPIYKAYGSIIVEQRYTPPGFALPLGLKDMGLVLDASETLSVPMPAAGVIREHMVEAMARGMADLDWSAIAKVQAGDAGL